MWNVKQQKGEQKLPSCKGWSADVSGLTLWKMGSENGGIVHPFQNLEPNKLIWPENDKGSMPVGWAWEAAQFLDICDIQWDLEILEVMIMFAKQSSSTCSLKAS